MSLADAMAVEVPEGVSGAVRVERFEVPADSIEGARLAFSGRPCPPGIYTRLMRGRTLWMSDTLAERRDHLGPLLEMQRRGGRVLVGGLGLGMIVRAALVATPVEHVDVLEIDSAVVALVEPHLQQLATEHGKTLTVHLADAFTWNPPADTHWTVAYFDVWPDLCTDNLPEMARLGRRYTKRRADVFLCWGRERLRYERNRERRAGSWW